MVPDLPEQAIVVQHVDEERQIVVYSYDVPRFADPTRWGGSRTAAVLETDTGVITDEHGRRLSA